MNLDLDRYLDSPGAGGDPVVVSGLPAQLLHLLPGQIYALYHHGLAYVMPSSFIVIC